jgi:hypothetical protein
MLVTSIARKALNLKRHKTQKVVEANNCTETHLIRSKRSSLVSFGCALKGLV